MRVVLSLTKKTLPKVPVPKVGETEMSQGGRNPEQIIGVITITKELLHSEKFPSKYIELKV